MKTAHNIRFILLLLMFSLISTSLVIAHTVQANNNLIDLSAYDFTDKKSATIGGYVDFYQNQLLSLSETLRTPASGKLKMEHSWDNVAQNYNNYPITGYGTYHFQIIIPDNLVGEILVLKPQNFIAYASVIKVNGVKVAANGTVDSLQNGRYKPGRKLELFPFVADRSVLDVTVWASNFTHFRGGIFSTMEIGKADVMLRKREHRVALDLIIVIGLIFMFLYHFVFAFVTTGSLLQYNTGSGKRPSPLLQWWRSVDKVALAFSLIALDIALDFSLQNSMSFFVLFPNADFDTLLPFQLSFHYLIIPAFYVFFYTLYSNEMSNKLRIVVLCVAATIITLLFATSSGIQKYLFKYHLVYMFVLMLYGFWVIIKAIIHKRSKAVFFAFAFTVLVITGVVDMLDVFEWFESNSLSAYGMLLFVFFTSIVQGDKLNFLRAKQELDESEHKRVKAKLKYSSQSLMQKIANLIYLSNKVDTFTNYLNDLKPNCNKKGVTSIEKKIQELHIEQQQHKQLKWMAEFEMQHPFFMEKLKKHYPAITAKEQKICALVMLGFTNRQIAEFLFNSENTIKSDRKLIRRKLNTNEEIKLQDFLERFNA